ncbi:Cation-dependent mannose-6-phosphate receptor [Ophiophagus hannah]|uniref:Cation-dependent mannose-6-phosphate receptor n=1 Tax=Ophiophagus hannah TaxID=8665 RepID=V8NKY3_OPHHA|nr:Cation-dependent mannose-6-phosphate receptor [Ophiophagus hannah]
MSIGWASLFLHFFARMFLVHAFSHAVVLAIIITVMAEEKTCDLLGEREQESSKEVALMNRLKPLFNQSKIDNKQKVIGRINETHLANGSSWILLIYQGGDPYGSHCTQEDRKALVMIICNRTTLATGFTMVAEEREKIKQCSYVFELESSLACPPEELHHNVHRHLSIGSILLITPTQTAKAEEAGEEMADGCDFMCRSRPQNVPAAYRGVGDDQLREESEEQDDHLLPM